MKSVDKSMTNEINHIAVIMDGNRRWAKQNNTSLNDSYKIGLDKLKKLILSAITLNIKHVTAYAFSTENWQRDKYEIDILKTLLSYYLSSQEDFFITNNIKLNVIGDYTAFGSSISDGITRLIDKTHSFSKMQLNLALNYGGKQEIVHAVKSIMHDVLNGKINTKDLTTNIVDEYLYTKNIPEPNLLIRTGGNKRLSNFLLWQLSYAELFFVDSLWPDFTEESLVGIINDYKQLKINKGK